jgi:hypothetical protein
MSRSSIGGQLARDLCVNKDFALLPATVMSGRTTENTCAGTWCSQTEIYNQRSEDGLGLAGLKSVPVAHPKMPLHFCS